MRKSILTFVVTLALLLVSTGIRAQSSFSMYEGFESWTTGSTSAPATGWDKSDYTPGTSTSSSMNSYLWYVSSSATVAHGGTKYAYLYAYYTYTAASRLKTPAYAIPSSGDYRLSFWLRNNASAGSLGDFSVYYSLDGGTTYLPIAGLQHISTGNTWTEYDALLPAACNGEQVTIVFEGASGSSTTYYYYLDDIAIETAPTCWAPINLSASNLTGNSVDFGWDLNTKYGVHPDQFSVTLKDAAGSVVYYNPAVPYDTLGNHQQLSFTGLQSSTTYTAYVRSNCAVISYAGWSDSLSITFTTLAPAVNPPYFQSFDSLTTATFPGTEFYVGGNVALNTTASYSHSAANSLKLTTTANGLAYIIFPLMNLVADNFEVDLWMRRATAESTTIGPISYKIGYLTDPSSILTLVPIQEGTIAGDVSWRNIRFNSYDPNIPDPTTPIMIAIQVDAGLATSIYIDDVDIHVIPTCTRPEHLTVSDVQANQVTLSWDVANAPSFNVRAMTTDSTYVTATATGSPFTLTGLAQNTQYQFSVQGVCSATDLSDWAVAATAKTYCAVAESTTFFEGAENTTGEMLPDCWTTAHIHKATTANTTPFYTGTTNKIGTRAFALRDMTSGNIAYLCSQALNFDSVAKYSFRYKFYRPTGTSYPGEGLKVMVTPTLGDTANAVEVIPFVNRYAGNAPVGTAGWNTYEGVINYQGVGYIMIVGYSKFGSASWFDNLEVFLTPTCPKVSNITPGAVTTTSATVNWTAGLNEDQWVVDYELKQGSTTLVDTTVITNAATYTFENLEPATSYTVSGSVRAYCNAGDTSEAVTFSAVFTTLCQDLNSLPYFNDFESEATGTATSNAAPTCWSKLNNGTSYYGYPYVSSSAANAHSGSKVLYFYTNTTSGTYGDYEIAILPPVDTTVYPINTLRVKFYGKRSTTTSYPDAPMIVGVMSDPSDLTTFVPVDTAIVNTTTSEQYIVMLSSYTGNGKYIAIRLDRQSTYCYCYMDDITLEEIPNCQDLNGSATASDVTENSVRITLADATASSSWSFAYGVAGTPVADMTAVDTMGGSIVINNLASATNYDLYVRRNCGNNNYSPWSQKVSFSTTAVPAQTPYVCGFEDATENANWMYVDGAGVNVFTIGQATTGVYAGVNGMYVTNSRTTAPHTYTIGNSNATKAFAYRTIHFDAKGYQVEMKAKCTGGESTFDFGRILLTSASEVLPAGTTGAGYTSTTFPNAIVEFDEDFTNTSGYKMLNCSTYVKGTPDANGWVTISYFVNMTDRPGNYNLVLMWNNDGSGGNINSPLAVDNISITELTCIPPVDIVPNVSSTTLDLTVNQATASQWEFIIDSVAFTKDDVPANPKFRINSTDGTATATDLTPNTQYWYSVRTICGANDTSAWLDVESIRTFCAPYDVPYTEGFDDAGAANCWSMAPAEDAGAAIARVTSPKRTGTAALKVTKATAVSPELNVDSLTHYMINGYAYSTADSATFSVGVMSDPNDASSFEPFTDVTIPTASDWTEFTAYFTALLDPDNEDFKGAKHIALATGDNTVLFDDIMIDLTPTCPKPNEVEITNITETSFDISFTDNANAHQWVVYLNGVANVINSTSTTISGLTAHTTYNVEIAAICLANDTSYTTDCGTVTTLCGLVPTPWICGFETSEGYVGSTGFNATTSITTNAENNCWNVLNNRPATSTSGYPYAYVSTSATYTHSGSQGAYTYASTSGNNLCLIFPEFSDPVNMMRIKFWYKNGSTTTTAPQPKFGYFTDPTSDTSFVMLENIARTTAWTEKEIFTNNASYNIPANARLGILIERGTASGAVYVDDISVTLIRNCSDPNAPTVSNITASTAEVAFTDTCARHNAWEYVYGKTGFDPNNATPVSIDTTVFLLSGLDDDANYEVYVRAVCGVGDESNYVKASFKTLCSPFHVTVATPFVEDFNDYNYGQYMNTGTCYTVLGEPTTNTYWAKAYPTTTPSATATTYYFYGHSADRFDKCLYWQIYNTYLTQGTILRQFHLDGGTTYEVSAWARNSTTATYQSKVSGMMGVSANALDTMVSLVIDGASVTSRSIEGHTTSLYNEGYQEIKYYVTPDSTGDYFIGYNCKINNTYSYTYLYFDDWTITPFTGCAPVLPSVDSLTARQAYISIEDTTAYQFEYVLNDTTATPTVVTGNTFVIDSLTPASAYTLYMRKYCDATNVSQWADITFRTECAPLQSLPYFNDFENEATGTTTARVTPTCWSQYNDGTTYFGYPYVTTNSTYSHSGSKVMYFYATTTATTYGNHLVSILPEVDTAYYPINTLRLKFWAARTTTTTYVDAPMIIGVMSDPTNLSTFVPVETLTVSNTTSQQFKVSLARYTGNGTYVAIRLDRQSTYCYCYIDDVTLEEIPACEGPENAPTFVSSTMTTLTVSADMAGKDTIEFGIAPATGVVSSASIDTTVISTDGTACFTGLTGSTNYAIWYRYYCGVHGVSAWSLAYAAGTTTASDCFAPQNLRIVGMLNDHHAEITWGRAPEAVAYEYELKRASSVVAAAVTTVDTLVFDTLVANTSYTIKVRTLCATDTSAWQTLNFKTTYPTFSLPFICNFENAAQNTGWNFNTILSTSANTFTIGIGVNNGGQKALYVSNDGATHAYTTGTASVSDAEILLEMPAGNYYVSYDWQGYGESSFDFGRVFLLPASSVLSGTAYSSYNNTLPTGAISLEPNGARLNLSDSWTTVSDIYNVPTTGVYKFVVLWANDPSAGSQPPFAIDNISVEEVACMPVNSVNMTAINSRDAEAVVNPYDTAVAVEYALSTYDVIDSVSTWTVATNDTLSFTRLVPGTDYTLFVRHACDSATKSPVKSVAFSTPNNSLTLPFIATFEANDTTNRYWAMTSGSAINWYTIGSATSATGQRSMYVTDDGSSHHYTNGLTNSYAYVPLQFNAGTYEVTYQWYCHGEGTYDYGHLFLAPASMIPEDNVLMTGMSGSAVPTGTISLDGEYTKLNTTDSLNNVWFDGSAEITIANPGTYNLIVAWHNDGSIHHQPPFAIDNIRIKELTCPKPDTDDMSLDSSSTDMFSLKIAGMPAGKGIVYHVASDATFADTVAAGVVNDSVFTVTGLSAATWYYAKIGFVCAPGDTSSFVTVRIRTNCGIVTSFPYTEDFESYAANSSYRTALTENCWNVAAYTTGTTAPYYYITATASYVHGGSKALYVYNLTTSGAYQTFAMPMMDTLAGKQMSIWYKNYNSSNAGVAVLHVGYLSNPNDPSTFVNLKTAPFNTSAYSEVVVNFPANTPANTRPAFKADGTYYVYVDDIHINNVVQGQVYYDTICFGQGYNAHGFTCAPGTLAAGDTIFDDIIRSTVAGVADSITRVNLYVRPEMNNVFYDTVCPGVPYVSGLFNIPNPTSRTYFQTFTSSTGCDSTVSLNLYVVPSTETIFDTICDGDAYQFGSMSLTQSGQYTDTVTSQWGCDVVRTLNLFVVDTATHLYDQACIGSTYTWEGTAYTQSGTYTKVVTGLHGCTLTKYLHLTMTPTDSICNVSYCRGGSVQISDTIIQTAGTYTFTRLNSATGCSTTFHVTATETQPTPEYVNDEACEGKLYSGYGVSGVYITKDTVITQNTRTAAGNCDSVVIATIKLNPITYGPTEYKSIDAGDSYTWHDNTYTTSGIYYATEVNSNGCDSICKLNLTVGDVPPTAVEDVVMLNISLIPNPVNAGETSFIYGNFTNVKSVEILNSFGQVIDAFVPQTYPIEVQGVNASGIYYVRVVTEDEKVAVEKLIVK